MSERDAAYLRDMILYADRARRYMDGVTRERLSEDILVQDAVVRALTVVGEAARRLSEPFREAHARIPWSRIVGLRHVLVHDYAGIDLDVLWAVVTEDVPSLIPDLERLLDADRPDRGQHLDTTSTDET